MQSCSFFLLIRSIVVVFYRSCFQPVLSITRFYIFFEETINIKESLKNLLDQNPSPKQSHSAIQQDTDTVLLATTKSMKIAAPDWFLYISIIY